MSRGVTAVSILPLEAFNPTADFNPYGRTFDIRRIHQAAIDVRKGPLLFDEIAEKADSIPRKIIEEEFKRGQ